MALGFVAGNGVEFGQARRLLDLSLRQVAAELGCSVTCLARWEKDPRQVDQERLDRWTAALERADVYRVAAVRRATTARRFNRNQRQEAESA